VGRRGREIPKRKTTGGAASAKVRTKAPKKPKRAELADRHALYQASVQVPEADIEFFEMVYKRLRGKKPLVLREDFCGTAFLASTWVAGSPKRQAIGIDLDQPTLDWGRAHNLSKLPPGAKKRIELLRANVLDAVGPKADVACALNFSYCVFKTRELLRRYFEAALATLNDDGIFVTELYGGTEAIVEIEDEREIDDFTYVWDQALYNPITHDTLCHIHFKFPDRSRLDKAFTYDWRLWTVPEVRELLLEAGFRSVEIWWEGVDEDGEGSGEFQPTELEENQESWLVYIVAAK
jgi:SAM-dependent methyltransferase